MMDGHIEINYKEKMIIAVCVLLWAIIIALQFYYANVPIHNELESIGAMDWEADTCRWGDGWMR